MSVNTLSPAAGAMTLPLEAPVGTGPILVATDGSDAARAAIEAAALIARETGARVEAVTAIEPVPPPLASTDLLMPIMRWQEAEAESRRQRVTRQLEPHTVDATWPVHVAFGRPAPVTAAVARDVHAALIVTGLGQHSIFVRMFGTETPLAIARMADAPVLCVPVTFTRLPRVVVVAVDFGIECVRAALAVKPLLNHATHVYLVHIKPKERLDMPANVLSQWEQSYEQELNDELQRVTETLDLPADVLVTTAVMRGAPAREILDFAASAHADLIVAGHGHRGRFERLVGGSIASQLFRGTQCALLLAPDVAPETKPGLRTPATSTETIVDRARWPMELRRFSERNRDRMATMEVDEPKLGAQLAAHGFPLAGADYDWRDDEVEITLGEVDSGRRHFTHRVRGPVAIAIQRDAEGRDRALNVTRLEGQTLLVLE